MFSDSSFWLSVWKQTKYKLTEYHFITGKLWVIVMIGICLTSFVVTSEMSYYDIYDYVSVNSKIIVPIFILWLIYISFDLGRQPYKKYDLFLSSTASTSFFSSYFYLVVIAFITAILTYLSKYPVLLVMLLFSPNDWFVVSEGMTSFFYFVSYCFANYLLFISFGFMWGILGTRIVAVIIAIIVLINITGILGSMIFWFMEYSMFFFWIGILIACSIIVFISYQQYKRLDVK